MRVILSGSVIAVSFSHFPKVLFGNSEISLGSDAFVRLLQPKKTESSRTFTESGSLTSARLVQFSNAPLCINVTPSGILITGRLLQPEKACVPIFCNESGSFTSIKFTQSANE